MDATTEMEFPKPIHNFGIFKKSGKRAILQFDFQNHKLHIIKQGIIKHSFDFEQLLQYESEEGLEMSVKFVDRPFEFDAGSTEEKHTICRLLGIILYGGNVEPSTQGENLNIQVTEEEGSQRRKKRILKEGILEKKGNTAIPIWSKRMVRVTPGEFSYFRPGEEVALNIIHLWKDDCKIKSFGANGITIKLPNRTYFFKVASDGKSKEKEAQRNDWIKAFEKACKLKRSTIVVFGQEGGISSPNITNVDTEFMRNLQPIDNLNSAMLRAVQIRSFDDEFYSGTELYNREDTDDSLEYSEDDMLEELDNDDQEEDNKQQELGAIELIRQTKEETTENKHRSGKKSRRHENQHKTSSRQQIEQKQMTEISETLQQKDSDYSTIQLSAGYQTKQVPPETSDLHLSQILETTPLTSLTKDRPKPPKHTGSVTVQQNKEIEHLKESDYAVIEPRNGSGLKNDYGCSSLEDTNQRFKRLQEESEINTRLEESNYASIEPISDGDIKSGPEYSKKQNEENYQPIKESNYASIEPISDGDIKTGSAYSKKQSQGNYKQIKESNYESIEPIGDGDVKRVSENSTEQNQQKQIGIFNLQDKVTVQSDSKGEKLAPSNSLDGSDKTATEVTRAINANITKDTLFIKEINKDYESISKDASTADGIDKVMTDASVTQATDRNIVPKDPSGLYARVSKKDKKKGNVSKDDGESPYETFADVPPPAPPVPPPPLFHKKSVSKSKHLSATKLKQVHWTTVPKTAISHSVWHKAVDLAGRINKQQLELLFSTSDSTSVPQSPGPKKDKQPLIDGKRAQNISILMKGLQTKGTKSIFSILNSVQEDEDFPAEKLTTIRRYQPTQDEIEMYKMYSQCPEQLHQVDQFMLQLCEIKCLGVRLDLVLILWDFPRQLACVKETVDNLLKACSELLKSESLVAVLYYILAIGNYMNSRHRKADKGFQLTSCERFMCLRGREAKNTLLQYLIDQLNTTDPELLKWTESLPTVKCCNNSSVKALSAEIEVLKSDLIKMKKDLKILKSELKCPSPEDTTFCKSVQKLLSERDAELEQLTSKCNQIQVRYRNVLEKFGESVFLPSDQFFSSVCRFMEQFDRARNE